MDCIAYINDLLLEIDILKKAKSSNDEIEKQILKKEQQISQIKENLSKMSVNSIEYRIYLYYLNGMSLHKAISKVADENYARNIKPSTERALYKNYYKKIKEITQSSLKVQ